MEDSKEGKYYDALNTYYMLKQHYYKSLHKKQKQIKQDTDISNTKKREKLDAIKMKCVNCKREVGTSFSETNRIFKAVCGDATNPCPLNIELVVGKKEHIDDIIANKNIAV